jgi:hypothetical protein
MKVEFLYLGNWWTSEVFKTDKGRKYVITNPSKLEDESRTELWLESLTYKKL